MLDRDEEVLVQAVGLLVLELVADRLLLLEPGALVDRVVELGEGVAYFAAGDEASNRSTSRGSSVRRLASGDISTG